MVAPGRTLDAASYNSFYGNSQNGVKAGIQWGNITTNMVSEDAQTGIHVTEHDIGSLFRSHPDSGIHALPVYKYVEMEVAESQVSETVLGCRAVPLF